jgi:hypothetical protein
MSLVYPSRRNMLMSYPRSGNTFLRYCVEQCTNKRTVAFVRPQFANDDWFDTLIKMGMSKMDVQPISLIDSNPNEIVLEKTHQIFDGDEKVFNKENGGRVILLLRDFKESIGRQIFSSPTDYVVELPKYKHLIEVYDNYEGDKIVIYYEDLITKTLETTQRILDFIGEFDQQKFNEFSNNLNEHKVKSVKQYEKFNKSFTHGNVLEFHASNFSPEMIEHMNSELYHPLTQRYIS